MALKVGQKVMFCDGSLWFPLAGGVVHVGVVRMATCEGGAVVRATKRRLGFLWKVHRDFVVISSHIFEVFEDDTPCDEVSA